MSPQPTTPDDPSVLCKLLAFAAGAEESIFVGGADGRVEWANDAACRLCGCSRAELIGRRVQLFPDDAEAEREASAHIRRRLAAGERAHVEAAALRDAAGRPRWIDLQVTPIAHEGAAGGWVAIAHDVTERKRTEEALAESEERYRSLVDTSPEPVAVHSGGRIVYANLAALRLLGARSAQEVVGRPVFEFLHPDFHTMAAERISKMEAVGDPAEPAAERLLRVDGTPVDVELVGKPIAWRGAPAIQLSGRVLGPPPKPVRAKPGAKLDLSSLVLELAPKIEGRIAPRAVVSFDLSGALLAVPAEATKLAELLHAVVAQAAALLPSGRGGLLLRTRVCTLSRRELGGFVPEGGLAPGRFLVFDAFASGSELDGALHARLFEPSFPERFPDSGPGLASALAIARSHRGALRVQSGEEGGVRISLALPAARSHS